MATRTVGQTGYEVDIISRVSYIQRYQVRYSFLGVAKKWPEVSVYVKVFHLFVLPMVTIHGYIITGYKYPIVISKPGTNNP